MPDDYQAFAELRAAAENLVRQERERVRRALLEHTRGLMSAADRAQLIQGVTGDPCNPHAVHQADHHARKRG